MRLYTLINKLSFWDRFLFDLKRLIHYFIGIGPYRVVPFARLVRNPGQSPANFIFESYTGVIKEEVGEYNYYLSPSILLNQKLKIQKVPGQPLKEEGIFPDPKKYIFSLDSGCIFGYTGIVYDIKTRFAVEESAKEWDYPLHYHRLFAAFRVKKPSQKKGLALSIATAGAEGGFYHFFHESLPKLYFCRDLLDKIDYLLVGGEERKWKIKWLQFLDIDLSKVIWLEGQSHYQFNQLLFTNSLIIDHQPSHWSYKALISLFRSHMQPVEATRMVWATRSDSNHRQFNWEKEVQQHFPYLEFVNFSELSAADTIKVCKECKLFIGPHGAAFSNLVFCSPQTSVIEIFPLDGLLPLYSRVSSVVNIKHYAVHLNFQDASDQTKGIKALAKLLESFKLNDSVS
jgi:capsular polysaccharide biosynthesis protein